MTYGYRSAGGAMKAFWLLFFLKSKTARIDQVVDTIDQVVDTESIK